MIHSVRLIIELSVEDDADEEQVADDLFTHLVNGQPDLWDGVRSVGGVGVQR